MYYFYNLFFDIMKKLHVILLLILVLALWILWWIYIGKSSKTNWISKQEIFENDLKCQEKLDAYRDDLRADWYTDIFVFYSPIENSCLWTFQGWNNFDNSYQYTIEKLSDLNKYAFFYTSSYYSGDTLVKLNTITDKFTNNNCSDVSSNKCKFSDIKEVFDKELEYLKWN